MDWIERCFDFAPDGGNGSLESFVSLVMLSISIALFIRELSRFAQRRFNTSRMQLF